MKTTKLLLVEDDRNFSYIVKYGLEDLIGKYEIWTAVNGREGYKIWKEQQPDVILTDIEMPVMDGFEMVEKIRETDTEVVIIFTSARQSPKDVDRGYLIGGNNYVKKPCAPEELHAHIQGLLKLKHHIPIRNESNLHRIGKFTFDPNHAILRSEEEPNIRLTGLETQILQTLCENRGKIVKREAILEKYWNITGKDFYASRCLDTLLSKLRKKLAGNTSIEINVIKGIGISLVDQPK